MTRGSPPTRSDDAKDDEDDGEDVDLADVVEDEAAQAVEEIGDEEILDEIEAPDDEPAGPPSLPPPSPTGARRGPGFGVTFETPWEELAQAYESLPADDQKTRHGYLLKIAEIWERGQHDVGRALGALDRAFNLDPANITVRAELQRIGREYNEWDRVSDIYLSAPSTSSVRSRTRWRCTTRWRASATSSARSTSQSSSTTRSSSLKSDDVTALDRIEQIYRSQERWGDLSNLLERRTSGPTESLPHGPERRAKFRELAELYETRLEKPYEAIDTLERFVAETAAEDDRAHGEAQDQDQDEEDRAAVDQRAHQRLRIAGAPLLARRPVGQRRREPAAPGRADAQQAAKVRDLRLRIATVYEKELGLAERAVEAYEALLEQIPDDPEALAALDHLHEAHGHFEDLQVILGSAPRPRPASSAVRSCGGARRSSRRSSATPRRRRRRCASWAPKRSPTTR